MTKETEKTVNEYLTTTKTPFTVLFPNVLKPKDTAKGPKYTLTMCFDDSEESKAEIKRLKALVVKFAKEEIPAKELNEKRAKGLFIMPFKEGNEKDTEKYPIYENAVLVECKTKFPPGLVNKKLEPIIDESEFYAGCKAVAQIKPYVWRYQKKTGIGLNMLHVMKVADGKKLGGQAPNPADIFSDFADFSAEDFGDDNFDSGGFDEAPADDFDEF